MPTNPIPASMKLNKIIDDELVMALSGGVFSSVEEMYAQQESKAPLKEHGVIRSIGLS